MGAPVGNKNAVGSQETERPFRDALRRAIAQEDGKRLRAAAERLLDLAAMGGMGGEGTGRKDGRQGPAIF